MEYGLDNPPGWKIPFFLFYEPFPNAATLTLCMNHLKNHPSHHHSWIYLHNDEIICWYISMSTSIISYLILKHNLTLSEATPRILLFQTHTRFLPNSGQAPTKIYLGAELVLFSIPPRSKKEERRSK